MKAEAHAARLKSWKAPIGLDEFMKTMTLAHGGENFDDGR